MPTAVGMVQLKARDLDVVLVVKRATCGTLSSGDAWLGLPWRSYEAGPPRCSLQRWLEWSLERSLERPLHTVR